MEADDKYDMWEEHVKFVLQEALCLARKYGANSEIVELGAMLHDISLIAKTGTRKDHHITSAEMAETILEKYQYPQDKIAKVKMCVLNHRSSKNLTDIECICVADADILAHFDNIPMLFNVILNDVWGNGSTNNIILPELRRRMKDSFEYDYNDLSERTKSSFSDRY
jgi:putative nucleotidyltransferase with HDIG domain